MQYLLQLPEAALSPTMRAVPLHLPWTASLSLGFLLLLSLCLDPGQAKELKFVTLVSTLFFSLFFLLPKSQRNQMSPFMFPLCYLPGSRHSSDSESEESHKFVLMKTTVSFAVDGTVSLQLPSGPMPFDWQSAVQMPRANLASFHLVII